jgi:hypothetical protein
MAQSSKQKYRPGIDDPPPPTAVTRAVHWFVAETLRLFAILLRRKS